MDRPRSRRGFALLLALGVAAVGVVAPAGAQQAPEVTSASPNKELTDRQWVRVDWRGTNPLNSASNSFHNVTVLQCRADPDAPATAVDHDNDPLTDPIVIDDRHALDRNCLFREDIILSDLAPEFDPTRPTGQEGIVPLISSPFGQGSGSQMFRVRSSRPQCSDGVDNDRDGLADFGTGPNNDPDCDSATDGAEQERPSDYNTFDCDSRNACSIVVIPYDIEQFIPPGPGRNNNRHLELNFSAKQVIPITFAPEADCLGADESLSGLGDPVIRLAGVRWKRDVCQTLKIAPLIVNRTSFQSVAEFAEQKQDDPFDDVDFAITAIPPTPEQRRLLDEEGIGYAVVPVALSAVTIAFNYRLEFTIRLFDLRLTSKMVAGFLLDSADSAGSQAAIQKNPSLGVFGGGVFNSQAGEVAPNRIVTSWIAANPEAAAFWASRPTNRGVTIPTDILPASVGTDTQITGEETVADLLSRLISITGASGPGQRTGLMYAPTAHFFGLQLAELPNNNPFDNPGGAPDFEFVAPTEASMTAAIEGALEAQRAQALTGDVEALDEFVNIDYASTTPGAYPLTTVLYMLVRTDLARTGDEGIKKSEDLKKYVNYVLGDGQKVLPAGYAPLPAELVAKGRAALSQFSGPPGTGTRSRDEDPVAAATTTTTTLPPPTTTTGEPVPTTTLPPEATTTRRPAATTTRRPATTTTTVPSTDSDGDEGGEEPQEEFQEDGGEEVPEESFFVDQEAEFDPVGPDLSSVEQPASDEQALPAVQFAEEVAAVVGKLQASASRFVLPAMLALGLIAIIVGSLGDSPAVLRGWNPGFESDLRRRMRDLVDRMLVKES
ncbi:MAG: hypothetical protein ACT4OM_08365 [Actinomycetota bacterium]